MALQALARVVEQRLSIEVAAHRHAADIRLLPAIDGPTVSPADFSRTPELIDRAYRATRKYLSRPRAADEAPEKRIVQLAAPCASAWPSFLGLTQGAPGSSDKLVREHLLYTRRKGSAPAAAVSQHAKTKRHGCREQCA